MSVYPDTKRPMQLCAAMVTGVPVYESTGIETTKAVARETFTHCLLDMVGEIYMGCYSLGDTFRISYIELLDLQSRLVLEDKLTIDRLRRYYDERMEHLTLSAWIDKLLDGHDGQQEIEFKWMLN